MNRREFLVRVGGALVAVPFVLEAVSCGSDDGPTATPTDRWNAGSEVASGHTHSITIVCTDLTSSANKQYTSTSTDHAHTVTLLTTELVTIAGGGQVTTTSSLANGHAHNWIVRKPSGTC